jgi:bacterial/archaeal transporter family protein
MAAWSTSALFASACIALHYLTLRAAAGRIGDALGAFVLEAAAAAGLLVIVLLRLVPAAPTTTPGLYWAAASGLCISGATTFLFRALRLGGPVSATGTLVLGGGVVISAALAPLIFPEAFTARRAVGVGLGAIAMFLLATERA